MKYSRIVLFSVGLFLLLVVFSATATLIVGFDEAAQSMYFDVSLHAISFAIFLVAYFYLGYKETTSPYKQAFLVAAGYLFIELGVGVLLYILLEVPIEPLKYLITSLPHVIATLLGTLLGIQLRLKKELSANTYNKQLQ